MRLAPAGVALACCALGFVLFVSTGHDDAYITYWASHALASTGEIVNYNGERVEQSSSLLHVLLLAGLAHATGASIVALGYWVGVVAGVLAVLRTPALASALGANAPLGVAAAAGTTPVLLYWSFAGLETPLAAWLHVEVGLLAAALLAGRRHALSPLALLVTLAFVTVRPEGAFLLGAALVAWLAAASLRRGPVPGRRMLRLWLGALVALFAGVTAFRLAYFGAAVPQPVLAKAGALGLQSLHAGFGYLAKLVTRPFALPLAALTLALPFLLWRELAPGRPPGARLLVLLLVGANLGFIVCAGGDSMIGGRFFAPVSALAVASGAAALAAHWPRAFELRSAAAALLALQLAGVVSLAAGGTGRPLWIWLADDAREAELRLAHWSERANRVHRRDLHFSADLARVISRQLAHQERVTIASVQAGMVMYYTALRFGSAIEFYDLKGLTTRHFMFLREAEAVGGNSWGLDLDLERYFALAKRWPEPAFHAELIFDIRPLGELAARNGYAPVLEQVHEGSGLEIALGPLRLGGPTLYYEWAAVRSDQLR